MSGEFKPVPTGAADLASYQLFTETCRGKLQSLAPGATIDPAKAQVFNRADGDGRFEVLYKDDEKDFVCAGQWHWPSQELLVRGGRISEKTTEPLAGSRISDVCQATDLLAGKSEYAGGVCREGEDPLLQKVEGRESVRKFAEYCSSKLQSWGDKRFGEKNLGQYFDLRQTRIDNSVAGDGFYSLIFESRANQFVCAGEVDATARQMFLHSGSPKQFSDGGADDGLIFSMVDACSLTTDLFGQNEIGECKDQSSRDRSVQEYVGLGVQAFLGVTSTYAFYRLSKRVWKHRAAVFLRNLPVIRNLVPGLVAGEAFDTLAGMFVGEDHALRRYGQPVATVVGMAAPELFARTAIGQRLMTTTFIGRAAPWASRLTWGLAAVSVFNWIGKKIMDNSDYESSVNSRVTDQVYRDDGLYDYGFWKVVNPLSWLNKSRRVFRAIAPDMMEGAVTWDNESVEAKIKAQDLEEVAKADTFISQALPNFLHSENPQDIQETLDLLRAKIELSDEEEEWAKALAEDGYAGLRSEFPALSDDQAETFCRKFLLKQVQQAAEWMVFVPGEGSDWARGLFNKNGTLKPDSELGGTSPLPWLQNRWPKPKAEKTEITSEAYEILGHGSDMA